MKIKIAERLRPFCHETGTTLLLPGTQLRLQIYPALIRAFDLHGKLLKEMELDVKGPLKGFTVQLDLEKGCIHVWDQGKLDYCLVASDDHFAMVERTPAAGGEKPALSLGSHKSQDWSLIKRRLDMKEILPHWHRLGYALKPEGKRPKGGTMALLDRCLAGGKMEIEEALTHLFQAGFEGLLFPRLNDEEHQGFQLPPCEGGSPLWLLSEGSALIQSLFFQTEGAAIHLLPKLPPAFHSGRFINLPIEDLGLFHFEWSKKELKKLIFASKSTKTLRFHFQKALKKCRLRFSIQEKGEKIDFPLSISVEAGRTYYFDRFEK